jgi:TolB-like protein
MPDIFLTRSLAAARIPPRRHVGVAVALGAIFLWGFAHTSQSAAAQPAASAARNAPVTLAVLPFANLSSDPEQEYFSDGLTEEILNQLAQIDALTVRPRSSSFPFKGKNEDVRVMSQKLGVGYLLEGSVRRERNQLHISAQLVSGKDGSQLWSKTYDRESSGVFALQEEIVRDVASALSIKLEVGETSGAMGGTTNLEAYDQHLRAAAQLRMGPTPDTVTLAAQFAREAVRLDPAFARARETLVQALVLLQRFKPEAGAMKAEIAEVEEGTLKLAPASVQARRILIDRFRAQRKWLEVESLLKSAVRKNDPGMERRPVLADMGRLSEFLPEQQRLCQQDPTSIACSGGLQGLLTVEQRYAEAEAEYQRSKTLDGSHSQSDFLAMIRASRTGVDSGIVLAQLRSDLKDKSWPLTLDRSLVDRIDSPAAARAFLRKMWEDPANQEGSRLAIIAYRAAAVGDTDLLMTTIQQEVVDGGGNLAFVWGSTSPAMRADPRFKKILRDVGLIDFFRATGKWNDFCQPVGKDDFQCH